MASSPTLHQTTMTREIVDGMMFRWRYHCSMKRNVRKNWLGKYRSSLSFLCRSSKPIRSLMHLCLPPPTSIISRDPNEIQSNAINPLHPWLHATVRITNISGTGFHIFLALLCQPRFISTWCVPLFHHFNGLPLLNYISCVQMFPAVFFFFFAKAYYKFTHIRMRVCSLSREKSINR